MGKVITGKVRFSYAHVFEPKENLNGGDAKYSVTLLIPKADVTTYNNIMNAINATIDEAVASVFNGVKPAAPKIPIYDGDGLRASGEPFGEECKGHWVIAANSKDRPEIVDVACNPIMSKSDFYSGCYGRASIVFFAYNTNGNKGVGCGLNNIQKLEDGQPLSGRSTAVEDFGTPVQNYQQTPVQPQPVNPQYNQVQSYQQTPIYGQPQPQVNPITGQPINNIYGV